MKILITTGIYPPDIGGPATYSKLLFEELPKRGIQTAVLSFGEVRRLPKLIRHISFFFKIISQHHDVDLIFAQDTVSVGLPSLLAAKLLGKRVFIRVPGDYAWEQSVQRFGVKENIDDFQNKKYGTAVELLRSIQKFVVDHADRAIAPSMYFRNLVAKWVHHPEKVHCVYNGIDLSTIPAMQGYESKTIFTAGRLVPWKGFAALIESMKDMPEWKLYIAGDGPFRPDLEKIAKENNVSDRVFLLGQIDRSSLIKRMQSCDVFVLNTHFESFSFQVVEAMAAGIPVITTNVGNLAEIVDDGKSGILITPDDRQAIVTACLELSSDITKRNNMIKAAKEKAQDFSIQKTVDNMANMIL